MLEENCKEIHSNDQLKYSPAINSFTNVELHIENTLLQFYSNDLTITAASTWIDSTQTFTFQLTPVTSQAQ